MNTKKEQRLTAAALVPYDVLFLRKYPRAITPFAKNALKITN
jgi:hypothetical protein